MKLDKKASSVRGGIAMVIVLIVGLIYWLIARIEVGIGGLSRK